MATTKIWDVSAHISKLLAYVANKNKTTMEVERETDTEEMRLAAEMLGLPSDHFATEEKKFVTGINCTPGNANEVIILPKLDKVIGTLDYINKIAGASDKTLREDGSLEVELQVITAATNEMGFGTLSAR